MLSFPLPIVPSYKLCPQRAHLTRGSPGTRWAAQVCASGPGSEAGRHAARAVEDGLQEPEAWACAGQTAPPASAPRGAVRSISRPPGFAHPPGVRARVCTCTHTHESLHVLYTRDVHTTHAAHSLQEIHHTHHTREEMNFENPKCVVLLFAGFDGL